MLLFRQESLHSDLIVAVLGKVLDPGRGLVAASVNNF